jgi:hypothetical protein
MVQISHQTGSAGVYGILDEIRLSDKGVISDGRQIHQHCWEKLLVRQVKNSKDKFLLGQPKYAPNSPKSLQPSLVALLSITLTNSGGNTLLDLSK